MRRHWRTLLGLLLMLQAGKAMSQTSDNMVFNPSFEIHSDCPEKIENRESLNEVDAWWQPTLGTTDYFHLCGGRDCQVPRNKMGYQTARSGDAYCGIYCSKDEYREYLQTELKEPLTAGRRYRLSFHASLADKSPYAIATLGALLTAEPIADSSCGTLVRRETKAYDGQSLQSITTHYTPQVQNNADSLIADSKIWTEISSDFTAQGGERFLTIGNFMPFNRSHVESLGNSNAVLPGAYYYIDDVSLVCLDTMAAVQPTTALPPKGEPVPMWGVLFAVNDTVVLPQSYNELHRLIRLLEDNPDATIELRGHTDNQGTALYNQRLSEARARAVARYLIGHGVDRRRITVRGFGKNLPIDSNDTPEGRSRNRRVEYLVK